MTGVVYNVLQDEVDSSLNLSISPTETEQGALGLSQRFFLSTYTGAFPLLCFLFLLFFLY